MRVSIKRLVLLVLTAVIVGAPAAYGQGSLQTGKSFERQVAVGQIHKYTITLSHDQFLKLIIDQKGIDVGVRVTGPDGQRIGDFDSPGGAYGAEIVTLVAEFDGEYRFDISPMDEFRNPVPGGYEIHVGDLRAATPSELRSGKPHEALRSRGVVLLNEILLALPEIRSFERRTECRIQAADLLWNFDGKAAREMFEQIIQSISESSPRNQKFGGLREKVFDALREHDPELALVSVRSLINPWIWPHDGMKEREIELSLAAAIAPKNPKTSFEVAENSLKEGLTSGLIQTVQALRAKNPELAARLTHDIFASLINQPLISNVSNAYFASNFAQLVRPSGKPPGSPNTAMNSNLLTDAELSGLQQKMVFEVRAYTPRDGTDFYAQRSAAQSLMATLKLWTGDSRFGAPEIVTSEDIGVVVVKDSAFPDVQVRKDASNHRFQEALQSIERDFPPDERAEILKDVVSQIGPGLKNATTLSLLEQARHVLPPSTRAQNQAEMEARFALARAFSRIDPNRAFEILEPLVDQFNDLMAAALTLNGFSETYFQDDEYIPDNGNPLEDTVDSLSDFLGSLAPVHFQRAKSIADRVRLPSIRIQIYLEMARIAIHQPEDEE